MKRLHVLVAACFAAVVAVAASSLLLPDVVASVAPSSLVPPPESRSDAASTVLVPVALVAVFAAGYVAWQIGVPRGVPPITDRAVERGASDAVATVGRRFRQEREWTAGDWLDAGQHERTVAFRDRLRDAAVDAYTLETDVDRDTARQAVQTGVWTDDRVAAWFLADEDERPRLPLALWLRTRLLPARTYRSVVDRTAAAIGDLRGDR